MRSTSWNLICLTVALLLVGGAAWAQTGEDVITFEGLPAGTIVSSVSGAGGAGPIGVRGSNLRPGLQGLNTAIIFDSANPTGRDEDLGTPNEDFGGPGLGDCGEIQPETVCPGFDPATGINRFQNDTAQGKMLIIAENLVDANNDGLVDDPDDEGRRINNPQFTFDFSALGSVTLVSMTILDTEEPGPTVQLFNAANQLVGFFTLPRTGNNGLAKNNSLGPTSGVTRMVVALHGSGAIDNIVFRQRPEIDIEKSTNGFQADDPDDPKDSIAPGDPVFWEYVVTNTGDVRVIDLKVADNRIGQISCPKTVLDPGESMTCTAQGIAEDVSASSTKGTCEGLTRRPLYRNQGKVTGESEAGEPVQDVDFSHYCNPPRPGIDIEKATNGQDADGANDPKPAIKPGDPVSWTYVVRNTGDVQLTNITVVDDQGVAVSCPKSTLNPGEQMTCTANGTAQNLTGSTIRGSCESIPDSPLYRNEGKATGEWKPGATVQDVDPSHYCNPGVPGIDIEKLTNGLQADGVNDPKPSIAPGATVNWSYEVTNTGDVALQNVTVTDDQGVAVNCPKTTLAPGEQMICSASGPAVDLSGSTIKGTCEGLSDRPLYENKGKATGRTSGGDQVEDIDPSHYCNPPRPAIDIEKATNGFDADDPNDAKAAILAGGVVTWTYVVRNTGDVALSSVQVVDDRIGAILCPKSSLAVGESMTCTANGIAQDLSGSTIKGTCEGVPNKPLYGNMGKATGEWKPGEKVEDVDPSHYCNKEPVCGLDLKKTATPDTIIPPPTPSCKSEGKPRKLTFRYTGGDCSTSDNTQGSKKFSCQDLAPLGEPIRVVYTGKDANKYNIVPANETVLIGDLVSIDKGGSEFSSETVLEIRQGSTVLQKLKIHTSCSAPLEVGDVFGSLELVKFNDKGAAGSEVTYTYDVTNNGDAIFNMSIEDDKLGTVASGVDLAPGQSKTFTKTAQISVTTTNVATALGHLLAADGPECKDTAEATVTVEEPPGTCADGKPKALVFEYTGKDCSASQNQQGDQAKCSGDPAFATPVRVLYTGKDPDKITVTPGDESLALNGQVRVEATGRDRLHSNTLLEIRKGGQLLQSLQIHTSCSQPLNVGDVYGSLILRQFIPEP